MNPAETDAKRLCVYNGGFLTSARIKRILALSGWSISFGKPGPDDWVGVWGKSPTSPRGEAVASRTLSPILRVEDGFLRSVMPGRDGEPPLGLCLDKTGVHFDSSTPSDLETLLATHPFDDTALLNRARDAAARLQRLHLSKYNAFEPDASVPKAPYVLVIDQTRDDASIEHGGANAATFAEMLVFAQTEHPGNRVVIKSHPDTMAGHRDGHFGPDVENGRVSLLREPVSPWNLMAGATAVYTVSSQLGFEAIYAGHKPRVFGQPFYAGWGLTQDENPVARRERKLTRAQLFAGAMLLYPRWYDPYRDRLCELEDVISTLDAHTRAWRQDHRGYISHGARRWKHPHLNGFFGGEHKVQFVHDPSQAMDQATKTGRKIMVWGSVEQPRKEGQASVMRIEDGFLRSSGLGAKLVPPLSLVADEVGIYYDPQHPSQLENHIAASADLVASDIIRAERLMTRIRRSGLSKYNQISDAAPGLPVGHRILVPGQVEDDMSVLKGCQTVSTNLDLLKTVRRENPDAVIVYKPHPDVEAGLRKGKIDPTILDELADVILNNCDPASAIDACDAVWTMTSTLGFEALIRAKPVTCLGMPFYAGWGLTDDRQAAPERRIARPTLTGLVHACLIDYPRYVDPVTGLPCPVEIAVERLADGPITTDRRNRVLGFLQGLFSRFRRV